MKTETAHRVIKVTLFLLLLPIIAGSQGQDALRFAPALTLASSSGPVQQAHDKGDHYEFRHSEQEDTERY